MLDEVGDRAPLGIRRRVRRGGRIDARSPHVIGPAFTAPHVLALPARLFVLLSPGSPGHDRSSLLYFFGVLLCAAGS
jgi:hypothetical protein